MEEWELPEHPPDCLQHPHPATPLTASEADLIAELA